MNMLQTLKVEFTNSLHTFQKLYRNLLSTFYFSSKKLPSNIFPTLCCSPQKYPCDFLVCFRKTLVTFPAFSIIFRSILVLFRCNQIKSNEVRLYFKYIFDRSLLPVNLSTSCLLEDQAAGGTAFNRDMKLTITVQNYTTSK